MAKIGVIGAMAIEVELLKSKFTDSSEKHSGGITYFEGKINGVDVVVVQSGVGKVNAALCAQRLILEFGVTHIINTGIAGAMAKGLKVFDLVVSTDAVYHDMDATNWGYKPGEIPQSETSNFIADSVSSPSIFIFLLSADSGIIFSSDITIFSFGSHF